MANPYLSVAEFFMLYDKRTMLQLSGDADSPAGNQQNLQFVLDVCASYFDSFLNGRVGLPLPTVPIFIKMFIADLGVYRMYGRRTDMPDYVKTAGQKAMDWLQNFMAGGVTIPGASQTIPVLQDSDFLDGRSQWDWTLGTFPLPGSPGTPGH